MRIVHISERRNPRLAIALFSAVTAVMTATSALCAPDVSDQVRVKVQATISTRCGFDSEPVDPSGKADLEATTSIEIPFQLDCNTPFRIAVQSSHGALRHIGTAETGAIDTNGFAYAKSYDVALTLGTNSGPRTPAACRSEQLQVGSRAQPCDFFGAAPGEGYSSVNDISVGQPSSLTVKWAGGGAGPRHLAGDYQDILTIFVGPRT